GSPEQAFLALDRHTGIVGHFLAAAGQQIEKCSLAAVWIAQQGDIQVQCHGMHGSTLSTEIRAASKRRKAKVVWPNRIAMGSSPGWPRAITRTRSPGRNPISIRRNASSRSCPSRAGNTSATVACAPGRKLLRRTAVISLPQISPRRAGGNENSSKLD